MNGEVAEKLNNFFFEAVENLEIEHFETNDLHNDIDEILKQYEIHPSVLKRKEKVTLDGKFTFHDIGEQDVKKNIFSMDPKKASIDNPAKILKGIGVVIASYRNV